MNDVQLKVGEVNDGEEKYIFVEAAFEAINHRYISTSLTSLMISMFPNVSVDDLYIDRKRDSSSEEIIIQTYMHFFNSLAKKAMKRKVN